MSLLSLLFSFLSFHLFHYSILHLPILLYFHSPLSSFSTKNHHIFISSLICPVLSPFPLLQLFHTLILFVSYSIFLYFRHSNPSIFPSFFSQHKSCHLLISSLICLFTSPFPLIQSFHTFISSLSYSIFFYFYLPSIIFHFPASSFIFSSHR